MLENIIGAKQMRRVLRELLHRHQMGAAKTSDFLRILDSLQKNALTAFVDIDDAENAPLQRKEAPPTPAEFMSAWLHTGSHPIVFVDYNRLALTITLTQKTKIDDAHSGKLMPGAGRGFQSQNFKLYIAF